MSRSQAIIVREIDLEKFVLKAGSHPPPSNGLVNACVMEAVAYVAGEPFSDHPECASEVIGAFLRNWNDCLGDEDRQMLKPYITKLVGTAAGPEVENRRSWLALDWLARTQAVAWLRLAKLEEHAKALEGLPELKDSASAKSAQPKLKAAGAAARDAARDAAGDAARDAAGDAARAAAGDALAPTVKELQKSALELLDKMIAA